MIFQGTSRAARYKPTSTNRDISETVVMGYVEIKIAAAYVRLELPIERVRLGLGGEDTSRCGPNRRSSLFLLTKAKISLSSKSFVRWISKSSELLRQKFRFSPKPNFRSRATTKSGSFYDPIFNHGSFKCTPSVYAVGAAFLTKLTFS